MHGFLLALCLWSVYAADMATPGLRDREGFLKGTDFVQFYNLGSLALHNRNDLLYDSQGQSAWMQKLVPQAKSMFFAPLYGPQVSLFFEPFARLPYSAALAAWLLLNALIYLVCCYLVFRACPNLVSHRLTVIILALAFPGFFHLITFGQTSGIPLLCFTLAFLALRANRYFLAGLAIGTLAFKPQFGLAVAVVFLISLEWKAISGAILAAFAQLAIAEWHFGWPALRNYAYALLHSNRNPALLDPHLYQAFSLRGFWILIAGSSQFSFIAYLLCSAAVLTAAVFIWRSSQPLSIRYSGLLLATLLVAPHCNVYDLVILAPAFLLLADWALAHPRTPEAAPIQWLLYLSYLLFLLEPLTRRTHLQLGVVGLAAIFWFTFRIARATRDRDLAIS